MENDDRMRSLLSAFSKDMTDDEFVLSAIQGMIASEISIRRIEMGKGQAEFAQLLGVSQSTLSKWESGDINYTLKTLVSIANKLGIEMQSPFVPTAPKDYRSKQDHIVSISVARGWSSKSSSASAYATAFSSEEIKEM